ncbi:MAG TPA: endonuclease/exonuclease/phosphatase family protein [Opitutaceae bacterium]
MQPCRVLTFNIAHGRGLSLYQGFTRPERLRRNLTKIAHMIDRLQPDVVALQEVDEDSHWNDRLNLLEYIRVHANFPHAVMGVNTRRGGRKVLNYGNAILSRHPIVSHENVPFGNATLGEKGFLFAEIDLGGSHLLPLINLHLCFRSRENRLRQIDRLFDYVDHHYSRRGQDWLVSSVYCGDLNNPSHRPDATRSLRDRVARHGEYSMHPARGTFPSPFPMRALDFVFLPPACREPTSEVVHVMLSDHRPVQVEFKLPGSREH